MNSKSLVMLVCRSEPRSTSPVKYEIFDLYSKIALNFGETIWKNFFQTLSRGNNQKELRFNGRTILIKSGNTIKTYDVKIPEIMELEELKPIDFQNYQECKTFIKTYCRYLNDEDEVKIDHVEIEEDQGLENKFKLGIINQVTHIQKFARRECRKNGLSYEICESLISTINALFSSKYLTSKSIMQNKSNGEINHIIGISINRAGFFIDNSLLKAPKKTKVVKKVKELCFSSSSLLSKVEQKNYSN